MRKKVFLPMLCLGLSLTGVFPAHQAQAQEIGSLSYYDVPLSEYYDTATGTYKPEYYQWKQFLEYNLSREQCQNYVAPPAGYVVKNCQVYRIEQPVAVVAAAPSPPAPAPPPAPVAAAVPEPVTIYFDFDKANIRNGENEKLNEIIDSITANNPQQIIIAGHTDTAGPESYNVWLSRRRAKVVADALIAKGLQQNIILQKAYGETDLAVPTADNVPLQANRRTVVIFVK